MDSRKLLIALSIKYKGDWFQIFDSINRRDLFDEDEFNRIYSTNKHNCITILDPDYPDYLKQCFRPPFVLFYEGDISLISSIENNLAVIGTREPIQKYAEKTYDIIYKLKNSFVIVSGLAKGIDSIGHLAALNSNKKTIAVIGCGLDVIYPPDNDELYYKIRKKGLLITEYPDKASPDGKHFPMRNRLVAYFSKNVFVAQSGLRSGTSITVNFAAEAGRDIFCLPSEDFNNSGCNQMIKEGAYLVENEKDIEELFR